MRCVIFSAKPLKSFISTPHACRYVSIAAAWKSNRSVARNLTRSNPLSIPVICPPNLLSMVSGTPGVLVGVWFFVSISKLYQNARRPSTSVAAQPRCVTSVIN
jgi:hypothetical protein